MHANHKRNRVALDGKKVKVGRNLPVFNLGADRVIIWPHTEWDYSESNQEVFLENLEEVLIFEGLGGCAFKAFKHLDTSKPAEILAVSYDEALSYSITAA